jgi:hydroxyquinol 1,2-dioxygenase
MAPMSGALDATTPPEDITRSVLESFGGCRDPRLRELLTSLTAHLHAFVTETQLSEAEWRTAIAALTATGQITTEQRQEWILWSDALGVSMLVDAVAHGSEEGATESTVLGPFYVPGSPVREYGARIDELPAGEPVWVHGVVRDTSGRPIAGAELDVWQNGDNELYAVQDPESPDDHLRGRFLTRDDGSYAFVGVRPTPYPIPHDGPVGAMLAATGRHPWRPAHIHVIARAPGYRTVTTHVFDGSSPYIDSDAVFAVKQSLLRAFVSRDPSDPETPDGVEGPWCSLECDFVLAAGNDADAPVDPGRTA